ncbi:24848_t:CDS:2 [Gigaspora margarita]|uniref:24848_t:CDS:1 n=1 Tax=Gigaspora margarita TaxID=4874 RepID=A0ABN7VYV9_GIGMA|nr:24848_t:CDS:2 [Gigaspora margarita]
MCSSPILWRRIKLIENGGAFGEKYEIQLKKFLKKVCKNSRLTYGSSVRYLKILHYHKLSNKVLGKFIKIFPNIIHLDFKQSYGYNDIVLFKISQAYPNLINLNYLEISWGGNITDKSIYEIARSCYYLRHLEISGGSYPDLRKLDLRDCNKVTDIGVRQIAQYLNLEHLVLNSLGFINDEIIFIIVRSCPNISHFNLKFCNVTDMAVETIAQLCRNIEYLNFYRSASITNKSISKLTKMCSKIQKLELGFCELITDTAIKDITQHLSNLKYLRLKNCVNISKEALDMLDPDLDIGRYYMIPSTL